MRAWLRFAVLSTMIITALAWVAALRWSDPMTAHAIWTSAIVASVVQLVSFAVARAFVASNPLVGWGLGSMVRFAAVIGHAVLGVPVLGVPSGAALMSLVVFLFVTMVLEPLFLRP